MSGAAAFKQKINLSCSTAVSTEHVIFDCLSKSCALCFRAGIILYNFVILRLAQLFSFSPLL